MCAKIQIYKYGLRYNELKYRGKKKSLGSCYNIQRNFTYPNS